MFLDSELVIQAGWFGGGAFSLVESVRSGTVCGTRHGGSSRASLAYALGLRAFEIRASSVIGWRSAG